MMNTRNQTLCLPHVHRSMYIDCTGRTSHSSIPSLRIAHQMTSLETRQNALSRSTKNMWVEGQPNFIIIYGETIEERDRSGETKCLYKADGASSAMIVCISMLVSSQVGINEYGKNDKCVFIVPWLKNCSVGQNLFLNVKEMHLLASIMHLVS